MSNGAKHVLTAAVLLVCFTCAAEAGDAPPMGAGTAPYGQPGSPIRTEQAPAKANTAEAEPFGIKPMEDNMIFYHVLFDELEGRANGDGTELRWEGQAWIGTDYNRLWLKSEGFYSDGQMTDGDQELLYSRPIWFLRYFDWQAGVRYDWDSLPGRIWGALGVEGLAPQFFETAATLYFGDYGVAARLEASYDILLTNRLIAQPQIELNLYSQTDAPRGIGPGLSDIDTGLRIRYEISRKFAPYVGVAYDGKFFATADFARDDGESVSDVRFVFGARIWL